MITTQLITMKNAKTTLFQHKHRSANSLKYCIHCKLFSYDFLIDIQAIYQKSVTSYIKPCTHIHECEKIRLLAPKQPIGFLTQTALVPIAGDEWLRWE